MPGNNGHDQPLEKNVVCLSLRELLRPPTCTNGVSETPCEKGALPQLDPTKVYELVILLPSFYNPDKNGDRKPIEPEIFEKTFAEIKQFVSGFRLYEGRGWCHSLRFRGDFDDHLRVELDALFSVEDMPFLQSWKLELTFRFQQDSIYMFFVGPIYEL